MAQLAVVPETIDRYVGTVVGESTSREFRLAVAHETIREQDIIAVDAQLRSRDGGSPQPIHIWAKVQRIERLNPLFPIEAGHELAATGTNPLDTVLSLSREMVTAVCQVLGWETAGARNGGKLEHLRYPAQPATAAYRPTSDDIARIVLGDLGQKRHRALDIATLSNNDDVDVLVDGHAIVTRHLAILAMTGSGKSWTARRIIEQLAAKNWPIVIFDPRGDYTGLGDVPQLRGKVKRYFARFPIFEQEPETVQRFVESLGWPMAKTHEALFEDFFRGAQAFISAPDAERQIRADWLSEHLENSNIARYGIQENLYFLADFVQALVQAGATENGQALAQLNEWSGRRSQLQLSKTTAGYLDGLPRNVRRAAKRLRSMETISRQAAGASEPLPLDPTELVKYGQISVIALSGFQGDFQAAIYSLIADAIFGARLSNTLTLPALLVLEEAHNFAPERASTPAEEHAVMTTRQIAQEGRKFGIGLVVISQRPSRLDETTLSQCNSYIIMRLSNPADQAYVRRVIETLGEDEAQMLPDLDVGEALLSGQITNFPVLVRVKPPASKGERDEEDAFESLEKARRGEASQTWG